MAVCTAKIAPKHIARSITNMEFYLRFIGRKFILFKCSIPFKENKKIKTTTVKISKPSPDGMNTINVRVSAFQKAYIFLFPEGSYSIIFFVFLSTVTSKKTHMLNAFDAI